MKKLTVLLTVFAVIAFAGNYITPVAAWAADMEELEELFDEAEDAVEEYNEIFQSGNWGKIESAAKGLLKQAENLAGYPDQSKNQDWQFYAHVLEVQAEELVELAEDKEAGESLDDYGKYLYGLSILRSFVPQWLAYEIEEALEEMEEGTGNKDKEETIEAADKVSALGLDMVLSVHTAKNRFANTRWISDVQEITHLEHETMDALDSGEWNKVEGLIGETVNSLKKYKNALKKR
jgi:hypothetical protein